MNCFPCCAPKKSLSRREDGGSPPPEPVTTAKPTPEMKKPKEEAVPADPATMTAQNFTFRELATATKNFRQECLMAEGGFGRIYRGVIPATGQVVAVKQLDRNGMQSSKEFLSEVAELSALHHENLVNLIGYCADGDQRLLVYELFAGRTLENRLFEKEASESPLNWYDRMKIAAAASKGLEYLHDTANPPVLFRDLRSSNILVDTNLEARLCDFGMAKLSGGDKMNNAPPRLMGTYGHCAPEYVRSGQLTMKSDVYSFGVVLLELITGRRVVDTTKPNEEQNLVSWAQPLFRDPKKYPDMADPILNKNFPEKDLNQVVAIASMCLQEEAEARPLMSDVVTALSFLSAPPPTPIPIPAAVSKKSSASGSQRGSEYGSESESEAMSSKGSRRSSVDGSQHGSSKSSRKSSKKSSSKKSTEEEDGTKKKGKKVISEEDVIKKMTKKKVSEEDVVKKMKKKKSSEDKELKEKSSRKSSLKGLSLKSSRKSSSRTSSHKSSSVSSSRRSSNVSSEDGETYSQRSSMSLSPGGISFGLASSEGANSVHNSSRRSEDESMHYGGRSSVGSDAGSVHSEQ